METYRRKTRCFARNEYSHPYQQVIIGRMPSVRARIAHRTGKGSIPYLMATVMCQADSIRCPMASVVYLRLRLKTEHCRQDV